MSPRHLLRPRPAGRSGDEGAVAGIEVLPFSVLVFVCGTLLLASAWGVIDAKVAVTTAAREAARAYAESDGGPHGETSARRAADDAVAASGRSPARLVLHGPDGALVRCGSVSYSARTIVPALRIPLLGGLGDVAVTARHTTRVDRLRAGPRGEVPC